MKAFAVRFVGNAVLKQRRRGRWLESAAEIFVHAFYRLDDEESFGRT